MRWPINVKFRVTSKFGYRQDPATKEPTKEFHSGIDIGGVPLRTPIYAPDNATVVSVYWDDKFGGGNSVVLVHDDNLYRTGYAHLDEYVVKKGQKVKQGELIGYVGNSGKHTTGIHLHFSLRKKIDNKWVSTDPLSVLDVEKVDDKIEPIPLDPPENKSS